jgi:putative ABC transport system substrate-binding protein
MDTPDTPPTAGYATLTEYAAQHGLSYHQVYGWVRWGHLAGVRHGGRWWVRRDAPRPHVRKGGWGQEERLRVINAQRSPESLRGTWDRVAAAARVDPELRREIGRRGGTSPKRRRNHGLCAACGERPATHRAGVPAAMPTGTITASSARAGSRVVGPRARSAREACLTTSRGGGMMAAVGVKPLIAYRRTGCTLAAAGDDDAREDRARMTSPVTRRQFVVGTGAASLGLLAGCGRWPWQSPPPTRIPHVGYLGTGGPSPWDAAFRRGLQDLGYVEGQNLVTEYRFADGATSEQVHEQAVALATELVSLPVDVIAALARTVRAIRAVSATIPVVMLSSGDPVRDGFIASYARPSGNITGLGLLSTELAGKRLELLKDVLPSLSRAAALRDPAFPADYEFDATQAAAQTLGIDLLPVDASDPSELDPAFAGLVRQGVEGLVVFTHALANRHGQQIIAAASAHRLPVMYGERSYVANGGLVAYGPTWAGTFYRAATYVDKILKGAKPADLPVELPMRFDFVVNLKTARELGITFPNEIMLQVTEVIQ